MKEESLPAAEELSVEKTGTGEAEDLDLDWITLDNGWQLVIWDEDAWEEMGLTPGGLSRVIDALQAASAGGPDGYRILSQGEMEDTLQMRQDRLSPDLALESSDQN
ncbi:MAG TPA: hypothetical protein PKG76_17975 [Acidobacteriota bacterium]|nr:hypothetical protein [Acidobacteriota bacterium]